MGNYPPVNYPPVNGLDSRTLQKPTRASSTWPLPPNAEGCPAVSDSGLLRIGFLKRGSIKVTIRDL